MKARAPNTQILLVDDHALFREGAARLLATQPNLHAVGCCGSVVEAIATLHSVEIDLVLLDLDLGKERAFAFFESARNAGYSGKVLIVAAVVSPFEARRLIQFGAAGIFLKQNPPALLIQAINSIIQGEMYIDSAVEGLLSSDRGLRASPIELTTREAAVLNAICEGLANKEIAARVHISEALVKATLQHLFDKHGVRTRSQLVRIALERYSDQLG